MAAVKDGNLSIHRLKRSLDDTHAREITTLKMEIQQIMKGERLLSRFLGCFEDFLRVPRFYSILFGFLEDVRNLRLPDPGIEFHCVSWSYFASIKID